MAFIKKIGIGSSTRATAEYFRLIGFRSEFQEIMVPVYEERETEDGKIEQVQVGEEPRLNGTAVFEFDVYKTAKDRNEGDGRVTSQSFRVPIQKLSKAGVDSLRATVYALSKEAPQLVDAKDHLEEK